jgi:hypothetical protein
VNPAGGGSVTITSQSGEFATATYLAVGTYNLSLSAIPGITSSDQALWLGTVISGSGGFIITTVAGFSGGAATVGIRITDSTGALVDQAFYIHADLLGI